jgi:hypothetical protein
MIADYLKADYPSNLPGKGGNELKSDKKRDTIEPVPSVPFGTVSWPKRRPAGAGHPGKFAAPGI